MPPPRRGLERPIKSVFETAAHSGVLVQHQESRVPIVSMQVALLTESLPLAINTTETIQKRINSARNSRVTSNSNSSSSSLISSS